MTSFPKYDRYKYAFDPFYTATSLSEPTDVNVLHDLKIKAKQFVKLYASDSDFKRALNESLIRVLALQKNSPRT